MLNGSIDWIRLWILDRCVWPHHGLPVYMLIHYVDEGVAPWDFPMLPGIEAGVHGRCDTLRRCVAQGLIELYPRATLKNARWDAPLTTRNCEFENEDWVRRHLAVITRRGHDIWESEFAPDWRRFWHARAANHAQLNKVTYEIEYASDEILDALLVLLPAYFNLDTEKEVNHETLMTSFGYRVTLWKILPSIKRMRYSGVTQSDRITELYRQLAIPEHRDASMIALNEIKKEQTAAMRVLSRLSKKWDIDWQKSKGPFGPPRCIH